MEGREEKLSGAGEGGGGGASVPYSRYTPRIYNSERPHKFKLLVILSCILASPSAAKGGKGGREETVPKG